ncbi:MAG: alpha/beta fold hydrolase [Cyclobacteriaceae bacterium]|jgi:proline iminopeptidase|nr:hypothetical protein [Flammeovirgaceae bacterium]
MRLIAFLLVALVVGCQSPPPDESGLLDVNGTQLYYTATGQGEPLLIIHGGPVLDQSYLTEHFKPLAAHYRLIFYDQRAIPGRSRQRQHDGEKPGGRY